MKEGKKRDTRKEERETEVGEYQNQNLRDDLVDPFINNQKTAFI